MMAACEGPASNPGDGPYRSAVWRILRRPLVEVNQAIISLVVSNAELDRVKAKSVQLDWINLLELSFSILWRRG